MGRAEAAPRHRNIGFGPWSRIQKAKNNPMHSSRQVGTTFRGPSRKSRRSEAGMAGIPSKYLI
ncbi:hypothetical protein NK6_9150 [Bradyrhizobium diazoefficiens]|uniref:Uncharacterized protein n=1 Tax=Bradyrhizobium diazoefficiens TaxID=1355477 RepID=A0A0E4BX30_9BRAD|nr:hypothetical protein NK6_9150 [Bradyrhizobium diazoefficiens]